MTCGSACIIPSSGWNAKPGMDRKNTKQLVNSEMYKAQLTNYQAIKDAKSTDSFPILQGFVK